MMKYLRIALLLVAASTCATAKNITITLSPCNCGDDSVQINQAIITATKNGTAPGTLILNGTFDLSKSSIDVRVPNLTLTSSNPGGGTLNANGQTGPAIRLHEGSSGLIVTNLTIAARFRGITPRLFQPPVLTPINNVTITGNTLVAGFNVVEDFTLTPSSNWTVANNVIRCIDPCGTGVFLSGSNALIQGNNIRSLSDGISVQNFAGLSPDDTINGANNNLINNNTINAPIGINVFGGSANRIENNVINTAPSVTSIAGGVACAGISVEGQEPDVLPTGVTPVIAQANTVLSNTINASCGAGIQLQGLADLTQVTRNTVASGIGVTGIEIGSDPFGVFGEALSTNASVRNNTVTGGAIGIHVFSQAANNTVTNNNVSRSVPTPATPVLVDTSANTNTVKNN